MMTIRLVAFLAMGWAVASTGRAQEVKRVDTPPPPEKTESAPSPSLARCQKALALLNTADPGQAEPHEELLALANDQPDPAGNWSAWSAARNVTTTGSNDDDDNDGLSNGEEALLGTDPQTAATPGNLNLQVHEPQD